MIKYKSSHLTERTNFLKRRKSSWKSSWQEMTKMLIWISWLEREKRESKKIKFKKFLTSAKRCDRITELLLKLRATKTKNIDNWTIDNNPWKFLIREKIQERIGHEGVRQSRTAFTLDSWRTSSSVQCQTTVKREELARRLVLNWTQTKKLRQF